MREAISLEMSFIYYRVSGRRDQDNLFHLALTPFALTIQYSECLLTTDPRPYELTDG